MGESMCLLEFLNLFRVLKQEVDVVERIHQAVLLVAVDVKCLAMASGKVGDGLIRHVDLHFGLRVSGDGVEQLLLELAAHDDGQHEAVEQVVAVDVGK